MGHTVQSIKEVIKLIKALKFARYTTRIIFTIATDRQRHEDQESSSPRAHCKCNGPGTFCVSVSVSVLILAMIQDQALVASKQSKHYLVGKKSPGHEKVGGSFKMDFILQIQGPHLGSKGKGSSSHWVPPSNSWTNATSPGWVICIIRF